MCGQNWEVRVGLVHDIFGVADGDRDVAAALGARFVEKVFVEEIDALLELDPREKKRARSRVEVYLIDDGLLSACVGKCAAQGVHGGGNMRCAYEGVQHLHGSRNIYEQMVALSLTTRRYGSSASCALSFILCLGIRPGQAGWWRDERGFVEEVVWPGPGRG